MIHNLTKAEWLALCGAVDSREIELDDLAQTEPRYRVEKATLNRALRKARQLAPND